MGSEFGKPELLGIKEQLKDGEIYPYQFYNTLMEPVDFELFNLKHNLNFNPGIAPNMNINVYDIEVTEADLVNKFPDPGVAEYPVDTIVIYNNFTNTAYCLIRLLPSHLRKFKSTRDGMETIINKHVRKRYDGIVKDNVGYKMDGVKFVTECFDDDYGLVKRFWELNKELEPLILMGFNSIGFDDVYMYNRSKQLYAKGLGSIMSKYKEFQVYGKDQFSVSDYTLVDILKLYRPPDSGGFGYGESQLSYKLDYLATHHLGIQKLDLDGGFYENYSNNLLDFTLYNVLDVILTYKLSAQLSFMELLRGMASDACTFEVMATGKSRAFKQEELTEGTDVYRSYLFNKEIQK